jgi:hypothetical protein
MGRHGTTPRWDLIDLTPAAEPPTDLNDTLFGGIFFHSRLIRPMVASTWTLSCAMVEGNVNVFAFFEGRVIFQWKERVNVICQRQQNMKIGSGLNIASIIVRSIYLN